MKAPFVKTAYLTAFLLAAGYALVTLRGPHGVPWLLEKQREIHQKEEENGKLDKEIERMRDHIKRLETNPSQQELEVRERLKLLKPGEKVYITGAPK